MIDKLSDLCNAHYQAIGPDGGPRGAGFFVRGGGVKQEAFRIPETWGPSTENSNGEGPG